MGPALRKVALTAHVTSSVGWLGAVAAFLALAVAGLGGPDALAVRATYLAMDVIAWWVIVPSALASLVTGVVSSLGTSWGLFRHYWVLVKFLLVVVATVVLLMQMAPIGYLAGVAAEAPLAAGAHREARISLVVHAGGGLLVLLAASVLAVVKPRGLTRYGQRRLRAHRTASAEP